MIASSACGQAAPGSLDASFDPGRQLNGKVLVVAAQPDGKVIVGGDFADANSRGARRYIARLNADGGADTGFNPAKDITSIVGAGFNNEVSSVALQADGKIIVVVKFTQINSETHKRLAAPCVAAEEPALPGSISWLFVDPSKKGKHLCRKSP